MSKITQSRQVEQTYRGQETSDGAGVKLTRLFSNNLQQRLDPFLMLDCFGSDNPDDYIDELTDSIENQIQVKHKQSGFVTALNPKVYLGGSVLVYERVTVGGQLRSEWYPGRPVLGITLSSSVYAKKGGSFTLSYSVMN